MLLSFCSSSAAFFASNAASAFSISVSISPMPRMREAMRPGWKGSIWSSFSPVPMNLMGLPVTALIESAAPPLASPSSLESITPVISRYSSKVFAALTASWPVIASTTSRISSGLTAALTALSSSMSVSSTCRRPAVSRKTMSLPWRTAWAMAAFAMSTGFVWPISKTGMPSCPPTTCSCLMAAGR